MKKFVLIIFGLFFLLGIAAFSLILFLSFAKVNPAKNEVNDKLKNHFSKIVRIPQMIPAPAHTFEETSYFWEMETLEKEVTGVYFKYTPSYTKGQSTIRVSLEMPTGGDPSIFNKILPALISDEQSLKTATDLKNPNFAANPQAGYSSVNVTIIPEREQISKISWEYQKGDLPPELMDSYKKLENYPEGFLRFLISVPGYIISIFKG